ncbi:MAG: metallophosphoesterase [bacterium]|nr:metallophosphoesterase [bacterium]
MLPKGRFRWALAAVLLLLGLWALLQLRSQWQAKGCADQGALMSLDTFKGKAELRLIVLGDAGTGEWLQAQVAQSIAKVCAELGCDLVLYLGDNFYPKGVTSLADPQWVSHFESVYADLDLPFLVVLGNHDAKGSVLAQREYSLHSLKWRMPDFKYHLSAGPVELYGLNSNCRPFGWGWLKDQLDLAPAQSWRLVFAHHNLYGSGDHGDAPAMLRWLWDVWLGEQVDLLLSGHEHHLEHIQLNPEGTDFLISGGGGYPYKGSQSPQGRSGSLFLHPGQGFLYLQANRERLSARFFDLYGAPLYRYQRERTGQ